MKKFGKIVLVLMTVLCLGLSAFALTGCQGPQGLKGDKGDPGECCTHVYEGDIVIYEAETAVKAGLGYKTCTEEGCDVIQWFAIDALGYTAVTIDAEPIALPFANIGSTLIYDMGVRGMVEKPSTTAYASIEVAAAGDYDITLNGLSNGIVIIDEDEYEVGIEGNVTVTIELAEGYNTIEITYLKQGLVAAPATATISATKWVNAYTLNVGQNAINCPSPTYFTFTAAQAGTYVFTFDDAVGAITMGNGSMAESIWNNGTLTLEAGESVELKIEDYNWGDTAQFDLTITLQAE